MSPRRIAICHNFIVFSSFGTMKKRTLSEQNLYPDLHPKHTHFTILYINFFGNLFLNSRTLSHYRSRTRKFKNLRFVMWFSCKSAQWTVSATMAASHTSCHFQLRDAGGWSWILHDSCCEKLNSSVTNL